MIPGTNKIISYMHCKKCMDSMPKGVSPQDYQKIEVGWTKLGFQVWCKRHNCNILHVDFEGKQHPANTSREAV